MRPETDQHDWAADGLLAGAFAGVLLLGYGYSLLDYNLGHTANSLLPWGVLLALMVAVKLTKPSSQLTPAVKARRARRRAGFLVGALSGISVLFAIIAIRYLNSWAEVLVLVNFVLIGIGVLLALHVRFSIGKF